jgi:hypothetical protein
MDLNIYSGGIYPDINVRSINILLYGGDYK